MAKCLTVLTICQGRVADRSDTLVQLALRQSKSAGSLPEAETLPALSTLCLAEKPTQRESVDAAATGGVAQAVAGGAEVDGADVDGAAVASAAEAPAGVDGAEMVEESECRECVL